MSINGDFLWGVATSGYQSEGGYNGPGQPQNNWSSSERQGTVMSTGSAAAFWTHYEEDFQRCQNLGLNSFRLGLEWSRIQPSTTNERTPAPAFDVSALDAYAERIAACRRYGLEPIVTLHHFTHPAWLPPDAWLSADTLECFLEYVRVTVTHINRRLTDDYHLPPIHWYITINEPNILVSNSYLSGQFPSATWGFKAALQAYNYLLGAHIRAYNCIHDLYEAQNWPTPLVSLNTYCNDLYWSEKVIWDLLSLKQPQNLQLSDLKDYTDAKAQQLETALRGAELPFRRDLPYQMGRLARKVANGLGRRMFDTQSLQAFFHELQTSPRPRVFDYVALDYYDPFFAHIFRLPFFWDFEFETKDFRSWFVSGITSKWWDWRLLPEGLHFFCQYYSQELGNCPILIAENGIALRRKPDNSIATKRSDQISRSAFLQAHLQQIKRLRHEGVPLVGYQHWSLTDNYEWGSFTPRFGLFTIDFAAGTERSVEDHLGDRPSETYAKLIHEIGY